MVNVAAVNVLAELGTATWTVPQAIAYETAQEGVRQAIGYFAQLIAAEESADEPDAAAIAGWRADQQAWAARGQELTPSDTRAIKRIRTDADDLLSVPDDDDEDDDENESDEDDVDEADDADERDDEDDVDEADDADERDDEDDFDEVGDVGEADGDDEVLGRA